LKTTTTQVAPEVQACDRQSANSWRILDATLIGLGGTLTLFFSLMFAMMVVLPRIHYYAYTDFRYQYLSSLTVILCVILVWSPIVAAVVRIRQLGGFLASIGWNPNEDMRWTAITGLAIAVLWHFYDAFRGRVYYHVTPLPFNVGIAFLVMVILYPLVEELYYRGILYAALSVRLGAVAAVSMTTLFFVLAHPGQRLEVLPVAVLLGLARFKTRSVACCLAMHVSYNFAMAFFQFYG